MQYLGLPKLFSKRVYATTEEPLTAEPARPCRFFDLPGELRNAIYSIVLGDSVKDVYRFHGERSFPANELQPAIPRYKLKTFTSTIVPRAITQASKQLREETIVTFDQTNTFHVLSHHLDEWQETVGVYIEHVRKLHIGLACPCRNPWTCLGTLDVLPITKFCIKYGVSGCQMRLLPSCAHRSADEKC